LLSFVTFPQGSREARQPWAVGRNRFAVLLSASGLDQNFPNYILLS
jgi:hypothetical protein